MVKRFDIVLVNLDPTIGREIKKTRPAVIVSPDEMNRYLSTVIIAPLTSTKKDYPSRINCKVKSKEGQIVLDQIRTIDKSRIKTHLGHLDTKTQNKVTARLLEIFS